MSSNARDLAGFLNWKHGIVPLAEDQELAMDPPKSEAQRKAMGAAMSGHSTLGIPKSVGKEFIDADPGGKLPAKDGRWGARAAEDSGGAGGGRYDKVEILEAEKEAEEKAQLAMARGDQVEAKKWMEQAAAMRRYAVGRWIAGDAWTDEWLDENEVLKENKGKDAPKNAKNTVRETSLVERVGRRGGRGSEKSGDRDVYTKADEFNEAKA